MMVQLAMLALGNDATNAKQKKMDGLALRVNGKSYGGQTYLHPLISVVGHLMLNTHMKMVITL